MNRVRILTGFRKSLEGRNQIYHFFRFQMEKKAITEIKAIPIIAQKEEGLFLGNGRSTFIEKILTISVGTIIPIVIIVKVFIKTLRLLLTIEARASIKLARTFDWISACLTH